MIAITGARGFIASNLIKKLNSLGYEDLILVDEDVNKLKEVNLENLKFSKFIERSLFIDWLKKESNSIDFIFHLGARADTTEQDESVFDTLNLNYSKAIFTYCTEQRIPLIYASSAATYGNGEHGYSDNLDIQLLKALNPYGASKQNFDLWVDQQKEKPPFWAGLKFFNVYGENENHKGRMASVVYHAFKQIKASEKMRLFMSHKQGIAHGEQKRDFIYVQDVVAVCLFFFNTQKNSGLYNVGTGKARSFNDLIHAVFKALDKEVKIEYIPTPIDIRAAYQYFTQAEMGKLRGVGFTQEFTSLEDGVNKYIQGYLNS